MYHCSPYRRRSDTHLQVRGTDTAALFTAVTLPDLVSSVLLSSARRIARIMLGAPMAQVSALALWRSTDISRYDF